MQKDFVKRAGYMFDTFMFAFNAVMPILLLIALGYLVKHCGFGDMDFYGKINTLCFKLFLPISLFNNVYNISSLGEVNWRPVIYCILAVFAAAFMGLIVANIFIKDRKQKGVIIQGSFRSNYSIIGLPLAESLGGAPAVAFASIISAVSIPLFNALAVIVLATYNGKENEKTNWGDIAKKTATNPLIIGIMTGLLFQLIRSFIPVDAEGAKVFTIKTSLPFLYTALTNAGKIASPMMLFCLGARFNFAAVADRLKQIVVGVTLRTVMTPLLCIGGAVLLRGFLGITPVEMPALVAMFATPVAVSSVVMVAENDGDEQLAGQLVVWTSVLSMLSILIIVFTLRTVGML